MRRCLAIALGALLLSGPVAAQQDSVHVVREGDTLWDLARSYLGDPFLWPEIFRLNAETIGDPARIYPFERLRLPTRANLAGDAGALALPSGGTGLPVITLGDFYRAAMLAQDAEVRPVGVLAGQLSPRVVSERLPPLISIYDKVFVPLTPAASVGVGDRLRFLRREREIPGYGWVYEPTGIGTVAAVERGVATVVITTLFDAVSIGDLALPMERFPVQDGVTPRTVVRDLGRIIGFASPQPVIATGDLTFVDPGVAAGLTEGDELLAYQPPEPKAWGIQPEVPLARMRVVRVTERTVTARVSDLYHPALTVGTPVRLVASMR